MERNTIVFIFFYDIHLLVRHGLVFSSRVQIRQSDENSFYFHTTSSPNMLLKDYSKDIDFEFIQKLLMLGEETLMPETTQTSSQ